MNKKALRKLPETEAPETGIPPESTETKKAYLGEPYTQVTTNYVYTASSVGDILIINIFKAYALLCRVFIGKDDWFNKHYPSGKETSAMLDNVDIERGNGRWRYYSVEYHAAPGADEFVMDFFDRHRWTPKAQCFWRNWPEALKKIISHQRGIKARRLAEKHDKIRESVDNCMMEIREPPKDFYNWAAKEVPHHYIIYRTGERCGVCTHCGKEIPIGGSKGVPAKHKEFSKCPKCRENITIIRSGAYRDGPTKDTQTKRAWYIQKLRSGGICLRLFNIYVSIDKNQEHLLRSNTIVRSITPEWDIVTSFYEHARYFMGADGNISRSFEYGNFLSTNELRWCNSSYNHYIEAEIYPKAAEILRNTFPEIRYIPIKDIIKGRTYNLQRLIDNLRDMPWIEYLYKIGMTNMAHELCERKPYKAESVLNFRGRNIAEVLGVEKPDIKELGKLNPSVMELCIFREIKRRKIRTTVDQVRWLATAHENWEDILECLKLQSTDKFIRYIQEQTDLRGGGKPGDELWRYTVSDYCDYIQEMRNEGHNLDDTAVLNPYDLTAAHTDSDIEKNIAGYIARGQKYSEQLAVRAAEVDWMHYENDEYIIRPIATFDELIAESRSMHHCVGSYADRYARGRCTILCVRRKSTPDVAMATLELSEDQRRIVQVRGYHNCSPQPDARKFCDEWLALIPRLEKTRKRSETE